MHFNTSFIDKLPADPDTFINPRNVQGAAYSFVPEFEGSIHPEFLIINKTLGQEIGISSELLSSSKWKEILAGNLILENTKPYAMCYGGHQFGHWAGQLGDGRAINLFTIEQENNRLTTLQLKGAGLTPYSRSADGKAVLRSSIREYLCSEAMYHLGVPTTRALSLVKTGELVTRDMFYNGNPEDEHGAIVCRTAPSFIRFGNFQIFTARKDYENLKKITDYTISTYFSHLKQEGEDQYLAFFKEVVQSTIDLIVHWQRVGFVHGVMNTDNMSIHGLTIDYGPYGWLDNYDEFFTPNTTDSQHKRYRFGQQAEIAFWNCIQLANALVPLFESTKELELVLDQFQNQYLAQHYQMMRSKLGLIKEYEEDIEIIESLKQLLQQSNIDYTLFFRELSSNYSLDNPSLFIQSNFQKACYSKEDIQPLLPKWEEWFKLYENRLIQEELNQVERSKQMSSVNPKYIFRNYMAQLAIDQAEVGNYELLNELNQLIQQPYSEQPAMEKWYALRPDWAKNKPGSSMLSCSS